MYHIRREDNHEERSVHAETEEGFLNATQEAMLRSSYTDGKVVFEIVDDNGKVVSKVVTSAQYLDLVRENDPPEELPVPKTKPKIKTRPYTKFWFWLTALAVANLIYRYQTGMEPPF
jgi:hypothetical protein